MKSSQLDTELAEIKLKLELINDILGHSVLDHEEYNIDFINKIVKIAQSLQSKIEQSTLIKNTMLRKTENIEFLKQTEKYLLALEAIDRLKKEETLSEKDNLFLNDLLDVVENYRKKQFTMGWIQASKQMEQVAVWSETFNLPTLKKIELPSDKRIDFAFSLISSELNEGLKHYNDFKEILLDHPAHFIENEEYKELVIQLLCNLVDDIGDLVWVSYRFLMEFGLHTVWQDVFNAIYEANMSKFCKTEQEAQETVDFYMENSGIETYYVPSGIYYIIHSAKDYPELEIKKDKVLKNKYWKKPDERIEEIIRKAISEKVS